ncbi:hypothetical protein G647_02838 [Cladophialophora carrionii CBS 160.54]|uniref:Uncharacterized protein n=1 Tax=Cladophialophora carrionii CBS 160.54 TaxID=1279043 RepID=V9DHA9_9EURO|nr:uncharacterized protein G647_02838 [Cladophialophora carrionii CBS 160.54]ETI26061.1 hypothetical protein G647_02838 [Cladophialophora carrionii CBS 160.54]
MERASRKNCSGVLARPINAVGCGGLSISRAS